MSTFATLKAKVVTICSNNSYINVAYNYERSRIGKTPAAVIIASDNASDYDTTSQNMRTYGFTVKILVPWDAKGAEAAESTLVEVIDSLLDDFDNDFTLTGSALMVEAAPSAWGWEERDKIYRVATINIRAKAHYEVT
jgi:hypothetical protein